MRDARAEVLDFLSQHHVMTLATHAGDDLWAAAVFYVNVGFIFYFLSAGSTRHATHMAVNPRVAATIQADVADWPQVRGVQLEGVVERLGGAARLEAIARYVARYRFLEQAPDAIRAAMDRVEWYRLIPDRLYFVDNSLGFGHRDQVI